VLEERVTRLSDQHLANAIRDLLEIPRPVLETGALDSKSFLPAKPAPVTGGVAVKLQEIAEKSALEATKGITCSSTERECAAAFIDRFGARAFRRPLTPEEKDGLLAVYDSGREIDGTYAGGISLVIEAALQSPSFVYLAELGKLSGYAFATKLSLFLRDTIPDETLWAAAADGRLDTEEGLNAEIDRLLTLPEVRRNLSSAMSRFFDLEGLPSLEKGEAFPQFTPSLARAMHAEATGLIDQVLWTESGTLSELLTSRRASVDAELAALYGVAHPGGSGSAEVSLPATERAGILTRAGVMAVKASAEESSVVFRGLLVGRGLLCSSPPPPTLESLQLGEEIRAELPTERERAERRLSLTECRSCHGGFDPFGVTLEHYDATGRFRTAIATEQGEVPVDSSWNLQLADIDGQVDDAVALSTKLAESRAVRECVTQQLAAYAVGERLAPADVCTVGEVARRFEASGGNLRSLIKDLAAWPALRVRKQGATP
jgi:hypothetical protein